MKKKNLNSFYICIIIVLCIITLIFNYKSVIKKINTEQFNTAYLSSEQVVIPYLKKNNKLPNYYITKKEARKHGWSPEKENLCYVLPGKIIGGDLFFNREKKLPDKKDRKWFEADLNYKCKDRGTQKVIFSNDGLIFITYDHYKTFFKL